MPAGHFYSAHGDAADFTSPYVIFSQTVITSQVSEDVSLTVFATFPLVLLGLTYPLSITHYHTSESVCV